MTAGSLLILLSPLIGYAQSHIGLAIAHIVIQRHFEKSPPVGLDDYELGVYGYASLSVVAVVLLSVVAGAVILFRSMPAIGGAAGDISK